MKARITKWKWPLVRRKDYEETLGALQAVNKALTCALTDLERQKRKTVGALGDNEMLVRSLATHKDKICDMRSQLFVVKRKLAEEQKRADHFQKRCEAYEDAARRSGLHFQKMEEREVYCMKKYL